MKTQLCQNIVNYCATATCSRVCATSVASAGAAKASPETGAETVADVASGARGCKLATSKGASAIATTAARLGTLRRNRAGMVLLLLWPDYETELVTSR